MGARIVPVIMAGGKGTRLWPLSRATAPKQFISFIGDETLFQKSLGRVSDPARYHPPIIITNEDFRFLAAEQARAMDIVPGAILLEPEARNTAPAIAAAAVAASGLYGADAVLFVLASDHEIAAGTLFAETVSGAAEAAGSQGLIVTFGIEPTEPATGYGYIEAETTAENGICRVRRFVEKPDVETAARLIAKGGHTWNSGMFVARADVFLAELEHHAPQVACHARAAVEAGTRDLDFTRLDRAAFAACPDISIDYAVMEKTANAAVIPSAFAWSDLGSWDAVWKTGTPDADGNVSNGRATLVDTRNSLVMSNHSHLAVQGLEGVAVIASEDAVYVGRLDAAQKVGQLVKLLAAEPATRDLTVTHPTSYRPWGGYTSVLKGERFQVKRIFVHPGMKLSLQKHHHRSEHWIVVRGTAEVTIGEEVRMLGENQSVYIPLGAVHRLANPGRIDLELIEVQTGSYLGEDDIIRLDDAFGRS